jgi:hypothetical protein
MENMRDLGEEATDKLQAYPTGNRIDLDSLMQSGGRGAARVYSSRDLALVGRKGIALSLINIGQAPVIEISQRTRCVYKVKLTSCLSWLIINSSLQVEKLQIENHFSAWTAPRSFIRTLYEQLKAVNTWLSKKIMRLTYKTPKRLSSIAFWDCPEVRWPQSNTLTS